MDGTTLILYLQGVVLVIAAVVIIIQHEQIHGGAVRYQRDKRITDLEGERDVYREWMLRALEEASACRKALLDKQREAKEDNPHA